MVMSPMQPDMPFEVLNSFEVILKPCGKPPKYRDESVLSSPLTVSASTISVSSMLIVILVKCMTKDKKTARMNQKSSPFDLHTTHIYRRKPFASRWWATSISMDQN